MRSFSARLCISGSDPNWPSAVPPLRSALKNNEYQPIVSVVSGQEQIFDIDQLSEYLRVPKSTLYRLAAEGKIPSHKVGRHWRFRREAVDHWLDRRDEYVPTSEGN